MNLYTVLDKIQSPIFSHGFFVLEKKKKVSRMEGHPLYLVFMYSFMYMF